MKKIHANNLKVVGNKTNIKAKVNLTVHCNAKKKLNKVRVELNGNECKSSGTLFNLLECGIGRRILFSLLGSHLYQLRNHHQSQTRRRENFDFEN